MKECKNYKDFDDYGFKKLISTSVSLEKLALNLNIPLEEVKTKFCLPLSIKNICLLANGDQISDLLRGADNDAISAAQLRKHLHSQFMSEKSIKNDESDVIGELILPSFR